MKAEEIRIGNLVLNDRCVNTITLIANEYVSLKTKQGNTITAHTNLLQPIPLTEEWLVKYGARQINHIPFTLFIIQSKIVA